MSVEQDEQQYIGVHVRGGREGFYFLLRRILCLRLVSGGKRGTRLLMSAWVRT